MKVLDSDGLKSVASGINKHLAPIRSDISTLKISVALLGASGNEGTRGFDATIPNAMTALMAMVQHFYNGTGEFANTTLHRLKILVVGTVTSFGTFNLNTNNPTAGKLS